MGTEFCKFFCKHGMLLHSRSSTSSSSIRSQEKQADHSPYAWSNSNNPQHPLLFYFSKFEMDLPTDSTVWPVNHWLNYVLLAMKARRVSKSRAPRCLPTGTPFLNRMRVGNPGTSYLSASLECLVASTIAICTHAHKFTFKLKTLQSRRHDDGTETLS